MWVPLIFLFNWVKYPAGVGCHFLLQGNFSTQGLNVGLLPSMRETRVRSLGQEVPLEKEMATHSSILAWRIPWMEEPGRL